MRWVMEHWSVSNWRNNLPYFYMPVLQVFLSSILGNNFKDQMRQSSSIYFHHCNIINSSIKIRYFRKMTYIFSTHLFNMEYVKQHTADDLPSPLATHKTLHYFWHALGAIDGSHIPIKAPAQYLDACHNWKGFVSQNCLFVCSFDFFFTYALTSWEGSASDARVYHEQSEQQKIYWLYHLDHICLLMVAIHIARNFWLLITTHAITLQNGVG